MKPEPCGLALTLLSRAEVCPACEHIAGNHPRWLRELARGAIPNPDPDVEEELEEDVPLEAIAVPRVRWAVGGGLGASPPASRPEELEDDASPALEAEAVRRAARSSSRARLVAAALRSSAASLLELAAALEEELEEGA